jgi:hypothetical protein
MSISIKIYAEGNVANARLQMETIELLCSGETIGEALMNLSKQLHLRRKSILSRNEFVYPITSLEADDLRTLEEFRWM